jgi:hypothetical protein
MKCHAEQLTKLCGDILVLVDIAIVIQKYMEIKIYRTKILSIFCMGVKIVVLS